VIGLTAGSVRSNDAASGRSTRRFRKLRNKLLNRIIQLEAAFFEQKKGSAGYNQLRI
jgi:hypothetical protein